MMRSRAGALAGLLITTVGVVALPALAQPPQSTPPASAPPAADSTAGNAISLTDVLQHAVRQSPGLATARIDVEVAEAGVLEATGLEDFLFNATGSYLRRRTEPIAGNPFGDNDIDSFSGSLSISKLLFTGGTIALRADAARDRLPITNFLPGPNPGDPPTLVAVLGTQATSSVNAEIRQPLLRGRGETVTRAQRTRAQIATEQARLQREVAGRSVVRDLITAYWEVSYAWADLEIRRGSLELARERRRLTDASVRGGATAPTEVLAVDQVLAQREEDVVVAELAVTERSLELRRLAGLEIEPDQIDVRTGAPLSAQVRPFQIQEVVATAIERSPEIAVLRSRARGAELEVEVTDNGLLPRLDIRIFGGPSGGGEEVGEAIEDMAGGDSYQVGGEVVLEHWLGNRAARGASRRAQAERQRVRVNEADIRRQVAQSAAQAVALARSAEKRMELSRTAIDLTQRNIKAETGRFELGKSSNFDVLLRQEEHTQARLRYARAATDYLRATAFLEALTGEILGRYGIKVE
jgi:outer membrane protein